ncbi:MAG: GGDEF domain-containing protein [Bdellovibrionales bacterium]|nr:GGDEF domain-containing protein [Bdellovibrionales bacterium]
MSDEGSNNPQIVSDRTTIITKETDTQKRDMARAKDTAACLIIVRGTPQGERFFITQDGMHIGRDPAVEISVADPSISRKHVIINKKDGEIVITDLGSSNGTFINEKKIEANNPTQLHKEDMLRTGNTIFKYLPAGALETLAWENLGSAAHTDPMTRIYNKGFLLDALESEFKRAKALHQEFSVLFFDLDHFKKINDGYGHDAGDYVLKEFTSLVKTSHLRPKDIFARYGGEEFVVLLANTAAKAAQDIAERIRAAVEAHAFIYEGKRLPVTTSMGVAELNATVESAQTLLKAADKALYTAKQTGRNKVVVSS